MSCKVLSLFLVPVILVSCQTEGNNPCRVKEQSSGREIVCEFPFKLSESGSFDTCTDQFDPEGKFWCSTRITPAGYHVSGGGHWGYCSEECVKFREDKRKEREIDDILDSLLGQNLNDECPCKTIHECPNLLTVAKFARDLNRRSEKRRRINQLLSDSRCEKSKFSCCDVNKLKTGKNNPNQIHERASLIEETHLSDTNSGSWRPEQGKCGIPSKERDNFPFSVLLGYNHEGRIFYTCAGTLINRWYVLTAAHCVPEENSQNPLSELLFGESELRNDQNCSIEFDCIPPVQKRRPAQIITAPNWNPERFTEGDDIALIRLDAPVILRDESNGYNLTPVCLPWNNESELLIGNRNSTTIIGWGEVTNSKIKTKVSYDKLRRGMRVRKQASIISKSVATCANDFPTFNLQTQICSLGAFNKDSCIGDSGGPLLAQRPGSPAWFQVGVVSYGADSCGFGKPGIYTKISSYMEWIKRTIKD